MTQLMRAWTVVLLVVLPSCKCSKAPSLGPLDDPRPTSLGETGLLVEQPQDGSTIDAEWVTVTGWVDRERYAFVAIVGAPNPAFYAAGGHVGVPSVPVGLRADGRFVAPRVPLDQGSNEVVVIAFTAEGKAGAQVTRTIQTARPVTPATVLASPSEGGQAPLTVTFEPHTSPPAANWQWDYDGDGRFDEESPTGKHTYEKPGSYLAQARTMIDGRWVTAVTSVQASASDEVTHQSTAVSNPRGIVVIAKQFDPVRIFTTADALATEPTAYTESVLVFDGDVIKVFDAELNLVRTLEGFRAPAGAGKDFYGRLYVADTGNNRVLRFLPDGGLDPTFGDGGILAEDSDGKPLVAPRSVLVDRSGLREDGGVPIDLHFVTEGGVVSIDCDRKPLEFSQGNEKGPEKLVRTDGAFGNSSLWTLKEGTLFGFDFRPRSSGGDVLDAAQGLLGHNPWWVVLRPGGRLEERFSSTSNVRVRQLGFPATAVAVDGSADRIIRSRLGDDVSPRVTGPHVLYVAGPGRLERRILPMMAEGLW